jgi:hypothetical protein
LSAADRLKEFVKNIDNYVNKIVATQKLQPEYEQLDIMTAQEIDALTKDGCFNAAYTLYQYADYINMELNKCRNILLWCDNSINEIVSREIDTQSQYNKYEIKVAAILKENLVAQKIHEWKTVMVSRINILDPKEQNVRRRAECLIEKGKRK